MKRKLMSAISILMIAALSACGPAAVPTMSAADAQGTAIADAWIALTLTQAAAPPATETPIPPTLTETLTPFPTIAIPPTSALPAVTDTPEVDPCNLPPPVKPLGTMVKIKLINKADGPVSPLSLGMMQENDKKECGTYTFSLGQLDEQVVDVLAGCYWGFGYVNGSKPSTPQTPEALCVTDTSKVTAIWITADLISFH